MTIETPTRAHGGGPARELTVEELTRDLQTTKYVGERVRRAVAWAVDHEPYANVSQVDRVLTAIDFVIHQAVADTERLIESRRDVEDIPF